MSDGPKGYEPLAEAKVEIWYVGDDVKEHRLVTATTSDAAGRFEVKNIREGRYRIEASKWGSGFIMNFVIVDVGRKVKKSDRGKLLTFVLGVNPLDTCGGGKVYLRAAK